MFDDIYLNLAVELYEKGTWTEDMFKKRVVLYAKDKNIDMNSINEFIGRVTKKIEYSIEEKRNFLSVLTFDGNELKYGDVINTMDDSSIEKFYEMEVSLLNEDTINKYHSLAKVKKSNENVLVEPEKKVVVKENIQRKLKISISDIMSGNYNVDDILGNTEKDSDEIFSELVNIVSPDEFNKVVISLGEKLGKAYSSTFAIEWAKVHTNEVNRISYGDSNETLENGNEHAIDEETKEKEETVVVEEKESIVEENNVIPSIDFEDIDMPETEEEFVEQAKNITSNEKDSSVKKVQVSEERLNKLKKNKGKVINYFLKTAAVVGALTLLTGTSAIASIGGYLYFSNKIREGKFNPENPVGKAIKWTVEKIMYMGMNKEEIENERGKVR